jgi:hypothetical protein
MPRAGGDSGKLGNRYEGWWTVHNLLDVLAGDALALQPEAYEESRGIEFIKTLRDGSFEFHSVKRQRPGAGWTLSALTTPDEGGRSILKDLFEKLQKDRSRKVVFVSMTIHGQALEAWDRSTRCLTSEEFDRQLETDRGLHEDFDKYVLPLCKGDRAMAFAHFRSLRLVPLGEDELRRQCEINVRRLLYRSDNCAVEANQIVLSLADFILASLGRRLLEADIRGELARNGYYLRDWLRDTNVLGQVERLNSRYLRHVKSDLILAREIPRPEAATIVNGLLQPREKLALMIVGASGRGKSCVLAQVLHELEKRGVCFVAIRLDNLPPVVGTKALGHELGLPDSPGIVLAGLSQGRPGVLVIDQLDAMSIVSGRNQTLWQVFEELIDEVRQHPGLRLLVACRQFDLEHDPRLARLAKEGGPAHRVDLDLLPVEVVQRIVKEGGGAPERLSQHELELLRTPFHLYLFLHGEPKNPVAFGGRQELFARFWRTKRQKANQHGVDFEAVVGSLTDELSRAESVSAPGDRLDLVANQADALVSDNVLVFENGRYRFFHESFFDYAFARRFVRQGQDLVRFLVEQCGEQHLFRRSQVRQVLAYQRDDNRNAYLATLAALLNSPKVRIHLKKLALDWLVQLEDPCLDEWQVVEPFMKDPKLYWAAFNVLWGRLPWFDLLDGQGVLPRLLAAEDSDFVDRCTRAIGQQEFLDRRSSAVAKLLRPYRGQSRWRERIRGLLQFGRFHKSREMFDFVLDLLQDGLFDEANDPHRHCLTQMAAEKPDFAVEFLERVLKRVITQAASRGQSNPFSEETDSRQIDPHFIQTAAQNAPAAYVERIIPIIRELVIGNARPAKCGGYYDEVWRYTSFGAEHDTSDALLCSAQRALEHFARTDPSRCEAVLNGWEAFNHKTLRLLLFCAWLGNPEYFAETAAAQFVSDPLAFEVDYDIFHGDGEARRSVASSLLKAISPHVAADTHSKLEQAIYGYVSPFGKANSEFRKYRSQRELDLWKQLLSQRLSRQSRLRVEELRCKFPERKLTSYEKRLEAERREGGFVPSPIPFCAFSKMNDEQWIGAFRRYSSDRPEMRHGKIIGGAWELHAPVRQAAKADRKRFAALALNLPDDISPGYFDAILWGLVDEARQIVKGGADGKTEIEMPNDAPLATEILLQVVQRVHRLPRKPCGKAICRLADALAKRPVPVELVEIIADYAVSNPDPETEVWNKDAGGGKKYYGGDPLTAGINSVRGSAADSLSRFLFAHPEMADRLYPLIEALAGDKSIAVRAVNIQGLLALWNTHRDKAVTLFVKTCEGNEALWNIKPVEDFLYHSTFSHYTSLQSMLRNMLLCSQKAARHAAARQVTLAAFRHPEAGTELAIVLAEDEECRRAAAKIYAFNVHHDSVRDTCISHLNSFFNDPAKSVRCNAADWLRGRFGEWTEWQRDLLAAFVQSQAFLDGGPECMVNLQKPPDPLPPEFLALAQKAVDVFEQSIRTNPPHSLGYVYYLPALVFRFYEQSKDPNARRECLDLIDRMLALGIGEAASELNKADR